MRGFFAEVVAFEMMPGRVLLQTGDDTTVLAIVVAAILAVLALFAIVGLWDRFTRGERETRILRIVEIADGGLDLVSSESPVGQPVRLDAAAMDRLVNAVEAQNELRLHAVKTSEAEEIPYEAWDREHEGDPSALVIEASKGLLELYARGTVHATPPLDDAVQSDLLELVERAREA